MAAEYTDTQRLDFLAREGMSVYCQWKNTGFCGPRGKEWMVCEYGSRQPSDSYGETLRAAIDAAMSARGVRVDGEGQQVQVGWCWKYGDTEHHKWIVSDLRPEPFAKVFFLQPVYAHGVAGTPNDQQEQPR